MTKTNHKLLRLTISIDTTDHVEMAFVRALLTRLNILHARLHNGNLADLLNGRELGELYKKSRPSEQTSSNGMVIEPIGPKLLPAPVSAVKTDPDANQRHRRWWQRSESPVTYKILSIREQKMPMPATPIDKLEN